MGYRIMTIGDVNPRPCAVPCGSHLTSKETGSKQVGFSLWKITRFPIGRRVAIFHETSRKNPRNRPVGLPSKMTIRAFCGPGWAGEGVHPSPTLTPVTAPTFTRVMPGMCRLPRNGSRLHCSARDGRPRGFGGGGWGPRQDSGRPASLRVPGRTQTL